MPAALGTKMDVARPDLKLKRERNRKVYVGLVMGLLVVITLGLARLEPRVPRVERSQVWTAVVERGEMIREVRGNGSLVPEKIVTIQSDTGGTIEDVLVLPGTVVTPDTVLILLRNQVLEQETFDLRWQLKAAEAQMTELRAQLESERFSQEATVAMTSVDLKQALLEAEANERLRQEELVAELEAKGLQAQADGLQMRLELEKRRLEILERTAIAKLAVKEADLAKLRASVELKQRQVDDLQVKAGIAGVLQQIGDGERLQIGARVASGATLAKVVRPTELKAEIKVPETQAKDVQIGQKARIDTRNGVIEGRVSRVDPAVVSGTVAVDVFLEGVLPEGARPELTVDGVIELERLEDVLFVGRPANCRPNSTLSLFRVASGGRADRVPVEIGQVSVGTVEVVAGLTEGEEVILSDMSSWDDHDQLQLD